MDINNIRNEYLKDVLDTLEVAFEEVGIDFYYIIGATAKNIWYEKNDKIGRVTKDIDFAVFVNSNNQFKELKRILANKNGYVDIKDNEFAMLSSNGTQIDILPFGEIEVLDGVTIENGIGLHQIKVNGFKEIADTGLAEHEQDGNRFKIATLPSIVLLKFIAYDDRPEFRMKDIQDIADIINIYFEIETDIFYDEHHDLLERIDEGHGIIASRVIGRLMKKTLDKHLPLKDRIVKILDKHIQDKEQSKLVIAFASQGGYDIEQVVKILNEISIGINEEWYK